jgi:hypothetical protein
VPFATPADGGEGWVQYVTRDGAPFTNGPKGTAVAGLPNFTSAELQHAPAVLVKDLAALKTDLAQFSPTVVKPGAFDDMPSDDLDAIPTKPEPAAKKKARKANAAFLAAMQEFKA